MSCLFNMNLCLQVYQICLLEPRLVVDTQAAGAEFGHQRQSKRASTFSALSEEEDDETPLALLIDIAQEIIVHPNGRFQASTARASIVNEPGQAIEFLVSPVYAISTIIFSCSSRFGRLCNLTCPSRLTLSMWTLLMTPQTFRR